MTFIFKLDNLEADNIRSISIQCDHFLQFENGEHEVYPRIEKSIVFQEDILALTSISEQMLCRKMTRKVGLAVCPSRKRAIILSSFARAV